MNDLSITPLQRITRYKICLSSLRNNSDPKSAEFRMIEEAIVATNSVLNCLSEARERSEYSKFLLRLPAKLGHSVVISSLLSR
jgi:hypothetical protein